MFYSVCIPAVLGGKTTAEALTAVAEAGYQNYEIWSWWDRDMDEYLALQQKLGLSITGMCTKFFSLVDTAGHDSYVEGLKETIEVCRKMGCKNIISQVGQELSNISRKEQHDNLVAGLRKCVPLIEGTDITLLIEPLNTKIDHKGYYLWESREAYEILEEVGCPNIKVLFDLYHQHIMNDLVIEEIAKNIDKIGHFHVAGYPGRHEPLIDSEIDYITILKAIKETGYQGAVGLEYVPVYDPAEGLKELIGQLPQ